MLKVAVTSNTSDLPIFNSFLIFFEKCESSYYSLQNLCSDAEKKTNNSDIDFETYSKIQKKIT